ncbi:signal peptidase I [Halobacteriales archaeon SW_7_68_16]|nr:MAG: signal peptidase I [Halobacteriales archaeon SW_7_68_16]
MQEGVLGAGLAVILLLSVVIFLFTAVGLWKVYTKAGEPGWAAFIPIYNFIVLLRITNNPIWYVVLFIIPIVQFIAAIKVTLDLADVFGKGLLYAIGLAFLPMIFFPLLGFGDARYQGSGPGGGDNLTV